MYHEVTYTETARRRRRRIAAVLACVLVCAVLAVLWRISTGIMRVQATSSVRDSVNAAALQCAAVEGSYPSSLEHLERYYGLQINHDDYIVMYEWFADNVPPTVTVVPR